VLATAIPAVNYFALLLLELTGPADRLLPGPGRPRGGAEPRDPQVDAG
jgi:hypothetical protein